MQARAELSAKALGDEMSDKPFILGETFSAADIMLGYKAMLAERFLPELGNGPFHGSSCHARRLQDGLDLVGELWRSRQ